MSYSFSSSLTSAFILFLLINHTASADSSLTADATASLKALPASGQKALGEGANFSVRRTADGRYRVFIQPATTPSPNLTLNGQVTLRVPHVSGDEQFQVSGLTTSVSDTEWLFDSRSNSPAEAPAFDYLSFSLSANNATAFSWQAGQETEVFSFTNSNPCPGAVEIINNVTDPFIIPVNNDGSNSAFSNPGNQINNLGWNTNDIEANDYIGNYGTPAECLASEQTTNTNNESGGNSGNNNGTGNNTGNNSGSGNNAGNNTGGNTGTSGNVTGINLQVRGILQGAYNGLVGLMRDDLHQKGLLPMSQPFSNPEITFDYTGAESLAAGALNQTGNDAPVDWVLVEILDASDRETRLASKAAILQRDGDVVDAQTGSTALHFPGVSAGNYFIGLNHRNHLGTVTLDPFSLSTTIQLIDFSSPNLAVYGDNARFTQGGIAMLWGGEADSNNSIISHGPGNDITKLLNKVLTGQGNAKYNSNFRLKGYNTADFNLDGMTLFAGPNNDSNITMSNVLLHPQNHSLAANFVIPGRKPKHKRPE
ncbi:MAG: hypothetical protein ACPGSM_15310 [Thiolinea sp.]